MSEKISKSEKLFEKYLDFVSSPENAEAHLRDQGLDPVEIATEGMRRVKMMQMQLASQRTAEEYKNLQVKLLQQAKQKVQALLSDVDFSLESFLKRERLNVAYKNFESLSQDEVREFLVKHFLLKLQSESGSKEV